MKPQDGWEQIEPGWYCKNGKGGICKELTGWYWYPPLGNKYGPFKTMAKAKTAAKKGDPE
jgi:hypothetical protein